jgi:hypothetical protein
MDEVFDKIDKKPRIIKDTLKTVICLVMNCHIPSMALNVMALHYGEKNLKNLIYYDMTY